MQEIRAIFLESFELYLYASTSKLNICIYAGYISHLQLRSLVTHVLVPPLVLRWRLSWQELFQVGHIKHIASIFSKYFKTIPKYIFRVLWQLHLFWTDQYTMHFSYILIFLSKSFWMFFLNLICSHNRNKLFIIVCWVSSFHIQVWFWFMIHRVDTRMIKIGCNLTEL